MKPRLARAADGEIQTVCGPPQLPGAGATGSSNSLVVVVVVVVVAVAVVVVVVIIVTQGRPHTL